MMLIAISMTVLAQAPADCVLEGQVNLKNGGDPTEMVVYLKDGPPRARPEPQPHLVKQRDYKFVPRTLVVMLNDKVSFTNDEDDATEHSVFSRLGVDPFLGDSNQRTTTFSRSFSKEGPVHVQCNVHPDMVLDVLVLRSPAFTRPDKDGKWRITGLERKAYTLVVWEPNGGETRREVAACATGPLTLEVTKSQPLPQLKSDGSRYRPVYQTGMY